MRRVRVAAVVVLFAAGAAGWSLYGRNAEEAVAASSGHPVVPVTAGIATARTVPIYAQGLGTVESLNTVNLKSRVDGQILRVFFTQGQEVRQGDALFLIDPRPFQAALDAADATLQKDTAQLKGAQRDLRRYSKLVGSGFQTRQSYEDQQATVEQLQATTEADQAAIEAAKLNLGYTLIRAPISGRTGALQENLGSYIQPSAGATLVTITQMKPIYVAFTLPGGQLDAIRRGQATHPLEVDALGTDGKTVLARGKLSFIDNHIDGTTGTIALKASFANADERLWPGAFVTARLILGQRPDAVTVPAPTIMTGPQGLYVYVIRPDDTVVRRRVTVLARQDGIAVIGKGLAAGEKVVVNGQYRLDNGAKVRIEPAEPQAAG